MKFICIDVGTSSCKVSVIDETGAVLASTNRDYALTHLRDGWASLILPALWRHVMDSVREISPFADGAKALMVSSLGETMVMLDAADRLVIDEGITYLDSRNVQMWNTLSVDAEALYRATGKRALQIGAMNQYLWWKRSEPEKLAQVKRILFVDSFVSYMLCGEAMMDYSTASNSVAFDINRHEWSPELAELFGFDLSLFPKVGRVGTPLGKIRRAMADELKLPHDLLVLVGCHDQVAALVGGGALQAGDAVVGEGSTEALNLLIANENLEKAYRCQMSIEPFLDENSYIIMLSRLTHGTCIKWFANAVKTFADERIYDALNQNCPRTSSGLTFLPYLSNTYFSDYSNPMGSFIGLDSSTSRNQAYRAVLEGLACETRSMCEELDSAEIPFRTLTATGGATKSEIYMQIKADILQRNISVLKNHEAGLSGLAMLCAVQTGCYADMTSAAKGFGIAKKTYSPAEDASAVVRRHKLARQAILDLYHQLI